MPSDTAAKPERTRPRARRSGYSRWVSSLKLALPIGALCLAAMLFLTTTDRNDLASAFSARELASLGLGLRLENPHFTGQTAAGDPFVLTADWALPDKASPNKIGLRGPKGEVFLGNGRRVDVASREGMFLRRKSFLTLRGDAVVTTSDGYRLESDAMKVDIEARRAETVGAVVGTGPQGRIDADHLEVVQNDGEGSPVTAIFTGNVRVTINGRAEK